MANEILGAVPGLMSVGLLGSTYRNVKKKKFLKAGVGAIVGAGLIGATASAIK